MLTPIAPVRRVAAPNHAGRLSRPRRLGAASRSSPLVWEAYTAEPERSIIPPGRKKKSEGPCSPAQEPSIGCPNQLNW